MNRQIGLLIAFNTQFAYLHGAVNGLLAYARDNGLRYSTFTHKQGRNFASINAKNMHAPTLSLRCFLQVAHEQTVGLLQTLVENIVRNYPVLQILCAVSPIHFLNAAMQA